jgi:ribonucleotide reductase beta subunit family protein with ferritin-like domain
MVVHYPEAIRFAEQQESVFWTANEIAVEKDTQDMRVNMTEAERHGVITTLKLFTLYELKAGEDYWLTKVLHRFPRPEIQRMAATFGHFELGIHAPFYNKINEVLMLNTDEFYGDYIHSPVLNERMTDIDYYINHGNPLISLGVFSLVEGAILYSSFAFLKHFQTKGKNKLLNIVRGINFSVRDENMHCMASGWLYRSLRDEFIKAGGECRGWLGDAPRAIQEVSEAIYAHEAKIVDMIFEKGEIEGITPEQMKTFVKARINLCLSHLGIEPIFEVKNDIISEWFYDSINQLQFNDFFSGIGNQYNRDWKEFNFIW